MNNSKINCSIFVKNTQDARLLKSLISRYKMVKVNAMIHNVAEATERFHDSVETLLFIDFDSISLLKHVQKPAFIVGVGAKANATKMRKFLNSGVFDFIFLPINEESINLLMSKLFNILKIQVHANNDVSQVASESLPVYNGKEITKKTSVMALNSDYIFIPSTKKSRPVKLVFSQIQYVKKIQNYVCVHIENSTNQYFKITLKYLMERLPAKLFMKINQSTVINIEKISTLENASTVVIESDSLKVARSYKKQLMQRIYGLK